MGEEKLQSRHQFLLSKLCRCTKSNLVFSELLILSFASVKHDVSLFWQHMVWVFFPLWLGVLLVKQQKRKNIFGIKIVLAKKEGYA